jgi:O-antigen/teichoic acid export membrane protein
MFDFGLARTTVRFVADATERAGDRLREIVLASVISQTAAGIVAGVFLFVLAPALVNSVFTISASARPEAVATFRVLAFHVPVLLSLAALRAALEGAQRFDISASLRIPASMASVVVPALAASAGASLPTILWILFAFRVTLAVISAEAVRRTLLPGRWALPSGFATLREMLGYSGWVAVSAALGPALGNADRFIVGSVVGVTGLGYYTGAAEAANRFLLIPATAFSALLPAIAQTEARGGRDRALAATRAAARQLAALLLPLCLALLIFAPGILRRWLGPVFAEEAGNALRILAIGVFLGGLAHLPLAVLYGASRPDLPAKIHLAEVIVYLPLSLVLIRTWGITGAALAWTLRCGTDFLLYEVATRRAVGRSVVDGEERQRARRLFWLALGLAGVFGLALGVARDIWPAAAALVAIAVVAYVLLGWTKVFRDDERRAWLSMLSRARSS